MTKQEKVAAWMESLGFVQRNVSHGYTGWFQSKDGSVSMVRPGQATFFYDVMVEAEQTQIKRYNSLFDGIFKSFKKHGYSNTKYLENAVAFLGTNPTDQAIRGYFKKEMRHLKQEGKTR